MVPYRISQLPSVSSCPGFAAFRAAEGDQPAGTSAADTGSATHRLIELLHLGTLPTDACIQVAHEAKDEFPQADLHKAGQWADWYWQDPRNQDCVLQDYLEAEVSLELAGIPFTGHVDQIRRADDTQLYVWDVKTGGRSGRQSIYDYAWQIAAYALGATALLGEPVLPGGIIYLKGYNAKTVAAEAKVFYRAPWSLEQCKTMLESAEWLLEKMQEGLVPLTPGVQCMWCPGVEPSICSETLFKRFGDA